MRLVGGLGSDTCRRLEGRGLGISFPSTEEGGCEENVLYVQLLKEPYTLCSACVIHSADMCQALAIHLETKEKTTLCPRGVFIQVERDKG